MHCFDFVQDVTGRLLHRFMGKNRIEINIGFLSEISGIVSGSHGFLEKQDLGSAEQADI